MMLALISVLGLAGSIASAYSNTWHAGWFFVITGVICFIGIILGITEDK